jgi:thimet oligopeptidase
MNRRNLNDMAFRTSWRWCAILCLIARGECGAQAIPKSQPPLWAGTPDAQRFEAIENDKLAAAQKFLNQLLAVNGKRTIENTLRPFDQALRQLNAAAYFASLMQQVNPDASFRDRATAMTSKVGSAQTALSLNRSVYQALSTLDTSQADAATRYYVSRTMLEFRLAGVDKDDATRERLYKLNDQLTNEQSLFARNIADGRKTITVADRAELDGLPEDYLARHKPNRNGEVEIGTDYPDYFPAMKFARSRALRHRLFIAFETRAYPKNADVLRQMMQTRYEIATLEGYKSWADYNAADKMVQHGERIAQLIQEIDRAARPVAQRELALLLEEKRRTDPRAATIGDFEMPYLQEQVRRKSFNFDSQSVRPYLPYARVKQGILDTAAKLFHVTFRQEQGVPGWAPGVETWDILDGGKAIGRFYLDMHPRPGKYEHAEMASVLDGVRGEQLPEAALICNFPVPTGNDPGLMEYADVVTFFHEFGHLVHWITGGQQPWAGISGISMEADFGEAPSQMLEEWMHSPQVLASFARHYKTGEPIPPELVERMNRASAFARGNDVMRQNTYTAISYDIYKTKPQEVNLDEVTADDIRKYSDVIPTPDAHLYASFGHLAGYSSAYYTYMWDKVIAEDFFQQFDQSNLLAGETPMRYRRTVLEPGGSMSANDLVKNFLGRRQNITAFQKWLNEEFASENHRQAQQWRGTETELGPSVPESVISITAPKTRFAR